MVSLRSGENRPWPDGRVTAYVSGCRVAGLLLGADGRALDEPWVDAARPAGRGVEHLAGHVEGVSVDLVRVPADVDKVLVVVSGWTSPPIAQLLTTDGTLAFEVAAQRLTTERALVMVEVYRREVAWKVRALALGHAGGLTELAASCGAPVPGVPTPSAPPTSGPSPAGDAVDPVRRIGMILDDASRTTAAYESSESYAQGRYEQELEHLVGDPSLRMGPAADAARAGAGSRRDELLGLARGRLDADLGQLGRELTELEAGLPASLAAWPSPGWTTDRHALAEAPWAVRLGEIELASVPGFRLPMVRALPLAMPLWIETEDGGEAAAARMMTALARRATLALPRAPRLGVVDVGGRAALGHLPLGAAPATDPVTASELLREHLDHVELVRLAQRSGGLADLPPDQRPGRLLLVTDVPGGLAEEAVGALVHLARVGAEVGTSVVLAGRRPQSLGIGVLDLLHQHCLRVPSAPGGDLVDTYGGVAWVFHPDLGPQDPALEQRIDDAVRRKVAEG